MTYGLVDPFVALICGYLIIGCIAGLHRRLDIAAEASGRDPVLVALIWVATWPIWVGKR